jgi:hypothetical protein
MKQMPNAETKWRLICVLLVLPLIAAAQVFDTTPPKIAHQPVKLGREGKILPIIAYVSDNSGVKSVSIAIQHDGQLIQSEMNQVKAETSVPVVVQTSSDAIPVYSTPGTTGKILGLLASGELLEVTLVRSPYYRIRTAAGLVGYIDSGTVQVVESGAAYRVTLPVNLTSAGRLAYQIAAVDDFGNETKTELIPIRFFNDEEIARLQGVKPGKEKPSQEEADVQPARAKSSSKPLYTKPVFWIATAAIGGGAYLLLSGGDGDAKTKKATVGLVIGW